MNALIASSAFWWGAFTVLVLGLFYVRARLFTFTFALVACSMLFTYLSPAGWWFKVMLWLSLVIPLAVLWSPPLRRALFSDHLLALFRSSMPELSRTEREALEAGTTWWDAELFTGMPRWKRLLKLAPKRLDDAEQAFIDGPVEQLCGMLDDWRDNNVLHDMPQEAWRFAREQGFFGMVIPAEYGGKGFSQTGHAAAIMKLATRSISGALTVMIPNSVGPGKLILKYGTDAQKHYWLPKLAAGEAIPCFALTGPEAGSDAGALTDTGVVCERDGVLGVRLDFDKRYITLGPVATVLGLAFKLYDPDNLLVGAALRAANSRDRASQKRSHGDGAGGSDVMQSGSGSASRDLGITLALVPVDTPGVETGRRHDPMHMAFMNGPVRGKDVFIPLDALIGGPEYAGKGWRMLMECLTDGRSISLPALSTAAAKTAVRATGAYARVRSQFRTPVGFFEGVEEALARIAGHTYAMDAARRVTLSALDAGHKPSVISAIVKYNMTERARRVIADALDVHGGAGVCLGPRNVIGQLHQFPPVAVTVEGANILTRSMMTFGQGAIRCHPYLLRELEAVSDADTTRGARDFDRVLISHVGHSIANGVRTVLLGLTGGRLAYAPRRGRVARHYRRLTRMSAAFALTADILLLTLRGELKRRERLSARMADVLSQLYFASVALKHFDDTGALDDDLPLVDWACEDAFRTINLSFDALFDNLEPRWLAWTLRRMVFPWGRGYRGPDDRLEHEVARLILAPTSARDRLTAGMYLPASAREHLGRLEDAFLRISRTETLRRTLDEARRVSLIGGTTLDERLASAVEAGVLTAGEAQQLSEADAARRDALAVDDFETLG